MFTLMLRFGILLFRLNVYDTLDDLYDSYYVYVGDFDDDEYLELAFFSMYLTSKYGIDPNDDRLFTMEHVNDITQDLYAITTLYC